MLLLFLIVSAYATKPTNLSNNYVFVNEQFDDLDNPFFNAHAQFGDYDQLGNNAFKSDLFQTDDVQPIDQISGCSETDDMDFDLSKLDIPFDEFEKMFSGEFDDQDDDAVDQESDQSDDENLSAFDQSDNEHSEESALQNKRPIRTKTDRSDHMLNDDQENDQNSKRQMVLQFTAMKAQFLKENKNPGNLRMLRMEADIGRSIGASRHQIYKWKKELGMYMIHKYSKDETEEIVNQFLTMKNQLSVKYPQLRLVDIEQIVANKLQVNLETIRNMKRRLGYSVQKKHYTDKERMDLIRKYEQINNKFISTLKNYSCEDRVKFIHEKLGIHAHTINKWKRRLSVQKKRITGAQKEEIMRKYFELKNDSTDQQLTDAAIAKKLKINVSQLKYCKKAFAQKPINDEKGQKSVTVKRKKQIQNGNIKNNKNKKAEGEAKKKQSNGGTKKRTENTSKMMEPKETKKEIIKEPIETKKEIEEESIEIKKEIEEESIEIKKEIEEESIEIKKEIKEEPIEFKEEGIEDKKEKNKNKTGKNELNHEYEQQGYGQQSKAKAAALQSASSTKRQDKNGWDWNKAKGKKTKVNE